MNTQEAKDALSEIIFQLSDGELNWADSLALGEPALKAIERLIESNSTSDGESK